MMIQGILNKYRSAKLLENLYNAYYGWVYLFYLFLFSVKHTAWRNGYYSGDARNEWCILHRQLCTNTSAAVGNHREPGAARPQHSIIYDHSIYHLHDVHRTAG